MTSDRKIKANRANARASTGPRTARGRARAARNAFRHGLNLPVCSNPALSEEVKALAREIAGPDANPRIKQLARRVAEAQTDLRRVRYARHQLLSNALRDVFYESRTDTRAKLKAMCRVLRPNAPEISMAALTQLLTSTPQGPDKFATILSQEAKRLLAMDRYERLALFRRKIAILAFDDARRASMLRFGSDYRDCDHATEVGHQSPG
jgi:hypothetical protein